VFDAGTPETAIVWHRPVPWEEEKEQLATRQVNAAATLMRLAAVSQVWPMLKRTPDPRVRSRLIHAMSARQVDPRLIGDRLREESEVSIRRALMLCLGEFHEGQLPRDVRERQKAELLGLYQTDSDPGVHAAVRWLLCTWGYRPEVEEADRMLARAAPRTGSEPLDGRQWYVTSNGHTMVLVHPEDFLMGSPSSDPERLPGAERLHNKSIGRCYAMSAAETTRRQFLTFVGTKPQEVRNLIYHARVRARSDTEDAPMTAVTWYEAARYCNWLSEIEGIPETEVCYAPTADETGKLVMRPKKGHLELHGYRLPTDAEWEYACRAGSTTVRYFGQNEELLPRYAWCDVNSRYRARPVASLKPNDFGLFDMLGNVYEWCFAHPSSEATTREDLEDGRAVANGTVMVTRGGAYDHTTFAARSAYRYNLNPHLPRVNIGFRVARTMP
jgi:formylglycine-generating enzyme required for sulfatase activity